MFDTAQYRNTERSAIDASATHENQRISASCAASDPAGREGHQRVAPHAVHRRSVIAPAR
jgi:hypothetical protein